MRKGREREFWLCVQLSIREADYAFAKNIGFNGEYIEVVPHAGVPTRYSGVNFGPTVDMDDEIIFTVAKFAGAGKGKPRRRRRLTRKTTIGG